MMAKAVLIMDMPEDCTHCPCPDWIDKRGHHIVCRFDSPLFRSVIGYDGRPGWCPLIDPANVGALIDALEGKHETD